jgi:hypothetical protein
MEISGKSYHWQFDATWLLQQLWTKLLTIVYRLVDFIRWLPLRIFRLVRHLGQGIKALLPRKMHWWESEITEYKLLGVYSWWLEFMFYFLDCFGFSELYETILDFIKFNSRPLRDWELKLAQSVFGNQINYKRVRIDEYAFIGPRQYRFCYVSFYVVNSWGTMQNSLLLHELTHVWQFQHLGAVYIPRALSAQRSAAGYNYGGVSNLSAQLKKGKSFFIFNLEQQADIVADFYRIREGYCPQWGKGSRIDLPIYETYIQQVRGLIN